MHHSKTFLDRSRDVETYDYTLALRSRLDDDELDKETEKKIRKKLSELDKKDGGDSLVKVEAPKEPEDFESKLKQTQELLNSRKRKMDQRDIQKPKKSSRKPKPLRVESLSATTESSDLELAKDIASKLYEEKIDLILRTVEVLGKEAAIDLFNETQEAENDGGILVAVCTFIRSYKQVILTLLLRTALGEEPLEEYFFTYLEITTLFHKNKSVSFSVKSTKQKKSTNERSEQNVAKSKQRN